MPAKTFPPEDHDSQKTFTSADIQLQGQDMLDTIFQYRFKQVLAGTCRTIFFWQGGGSVNIQCTILVELQWLLG